ncbi:hypothetical protein JHW45_05120 [Paracoccus stylophorae]|uniref:Peptidase inhibitor I78 family protein n=1 Tax=Paracoccus stylophorae TaxID=659350 RepID=A0ABY7SXW5_9RHOB|nr:I78 family peptidase inhibitor [Paracoccus stylophorae]WCR11754.1 hypothetical protein JHW45_05120 [Paracoccus stylophorae]
MAALPAMLAACATTTSVPVARCDQVAHQALVGQNIGAVTLPADLRQRIISPGDTLTQDHDPDRLNVFVDPKGWIARVTCG